MGILDGLVGQAVSNALGQQQQNSGLGGLLGSVVASHENLSQNQGGLGSMLGQEIIHQLGGNQGDSNKPTLLAALMPIVLAFIQKNGGLSGVLSKLGDSGLGGQIQSWVALDKDNDGIDAGDVMRLFGNDEINQVCKQTGASQGDVCQGIADILPQVISHLTPTGDVTADTQTANHTISEMLKQFGKVL